jgi:hypothetical protein
MLDILFCGKSILLVLFHFMWVRIDTRSGNGLIHDLVLAHPSWLPRRETDLFVRTGRSGVPRGYAPLVAGRKPEKGRQGAKRPLEGVFPSKEIQGRLNLQWSLRPFSDLFGIAHTK